MRPTLPLIAYINRFLCRRLYRRCKCIKMQFISCAQDGWLCLLAALFGGALFCWRALFFLFLAYVSRGKEKLAPGPRLVTRTTDRVAGWTLFNQCSSSCRSSAQFVVWLVPFFPRQSRPLLCVLRPSFRPWTPMRMTIFFHVYWSGVFAASPFSCSVHHLQFC